MVDKGFDLVGQRWVRWDDQEAVGQRKAVPAERVIDTVIALFGEGADYVWVCRQDPEVDYASVYRKPECTQEANRAHVEDELLSFVMGPAPIG